MNHCLRHPQARLHTVGSLTILPGTEFVNNSANMVDPQSVGAMLVFDR